MAIEPVSNHVPQSDQQFSEIKPLSSEEINLFVRALSKNETVKLLKKINQREFLKRYDASSDNVQKIAQQSLQKHFTELDVDEFFIAFEKGVPFSLWSKDKYDTEEVQDLWQKEMYDKEKCFPRARQAVATISENLKRIVDPSVLAGLSVDRLLFLFNLQKINKKFIISELRKRLLSSDYYLDLDQFKFLLTHLKWESLSRDEKIGALKHVYADDRYSLEMITFLGGYYHTSGGFEAITILRETFSFERIKSYDDDVWEQIKDGLALISFQNPKFQEDMLAALECQPERKKFYQECLLFCEKCLSGYTVPLWSNNRALKDLVRRFYSDRSIQLKILSVQSGD